LGCTSGRDELTVVANTNSAGASATRDLPGELASDEAAKACVPAPSTQQFSIGESWLQAGLERSLWACPTALAWSREDGWTSR
jgi:hypothetical protein